MDLWLGMECTSGRAGGALRADKRETNILSHAPTPSLSLGLSLSLTTSSNESFLNTWPSLTNPLMLDWFGLLALLHLAIFLQEC